MLTTSAALKIEVTEAGVTHWDRQHVWMEGIGEVSGRDPSSWGIGDADRMLCDNSSMFQFFYLIRIFFLNLLAI